MEKVITIAKALSEEKRLRVLMALRDRELCSCNISRLLSLSDSTVSTHMAILKRAGLVDSRKNGRWVHYRLPDQPAPEAKLALKWIHTTLITSPQAEKDQKALLGAETCQGH